MASKKTPAVKKPTHAKKPTKAKMEVAKTAATRAATKTNPSATGAAAATSSPDAVCTNLAALRTALAGEKAREGAAERKKMVKDLEALEAGYRELHK